MLAEAEKTRGKGTTMKAVAQVLTSRELVAIRTALGVTLHYKDQLPIAIKSTEEAFEKVGCIIAEERHQRRKNVRFLITPVELEELTKE